MMIWDGPPSNHTFSLLSEAQRFSQFGHIAQMLDETYAKKILITFPLGELEEIIWTPLYYVDEGYQAGPEIQ